MPFFFTTLLAQNPLNYLGSTDGGSAYEVFLHNNLLYVGAANTLEIWTINGPNNTPNNLVFKQRMLSNIDYITEHNGYLYVCANHDGLYKFDIVPGPVYLDEQAHYIPSSPNESVYDIAFYGDSIITAGKTKVNLLHDAGTNIIYQYTIASYSDSARVHGVDIKDSLLAYTLFYTETWDVPIEGIYMYDLKNMQPLDFYQNNIGNSMEVAFGENNNLLHVMGGQILSILPFTHGHYLVLDYSDPTDLQYTFSDTIMGFAFAGGSTSIPMSAEMINDTVYISTQGGGPIGHQWFQPYYGEIYVYDAVNSSNVHLLTDIYAGLYHFDAEIDEITRKMYVASEWYGIWTVDVSDIHNEIVYGKKHTGGWCHGSAVAKEILVEADEGFGLEKYTIDNIQTVLPQLSDQDTTGGFCRAISLSDSADYIYGWYLTGERLRVYDQATLTLISDTSVDTLTLLPADFQKSRYYNGKLAVIEDIDGVAKHIVLADVVNPNYPHVKSYKRMNNAQDILWHPSAKLFACKYDSIIVFDTSMTILTSTLAPAFRQFKSFVLINDTLFVFKKKVLIGNDEIARYYFDDVNNTLTLISSDQFPMSSKHRIFMAFDSNYIYITSSTDPLNAIPKSPPYIPVDSYTHGGEHIYNNLWGVHDLYWKDGYLFLNEYMGQTSIFGPPDISDIEVPYTNDAFGIYPNPASEYFIIHLNSFEDHLIKVFSAEGKLMYAANWTGDKINLSTYGWDAGIYVVSVITNGMERSSKLVVTK